MPLPDRHHRRWQRARRATLGLLLVWGVVTFGATFFARQLDFQLFGVPFGYWMASQGALLVYLVLIAAHAAIAHRLDLADRDAVDPA